MAIRVTCTSCDETFSVSENMRGKKVRCKECDKLVTVPGGKSKADPDADIVEEKKRTKLKAKSRFRDDDLDDDEDDEDSVDEPAGRGRSTSKGGNPVLLIAVGGGALLVAADVLFLVFRPGSTASAPLAQNNKPKQDDSNPNSGKNNDGEDPEPKTNPIPDPNKDKYPGKDKDPGKTQDPTPKTNPDPEPVLPGAAISGEKIYQRLLKSTVF